MTLPWFIRESLPLLDHRDGVASRTGRTRRIRRIFEGSSIPESTSPGFGAAHPNACTQRAGHHIVYGTSEEAQRSTITKWAREAVYSEEKYLAPLPEPFRQAIEGMIETLKEY